MWQLTGVNLGILFFVHILLIKQPLVMHSKTYKFAFVINGLLPSICTVAYLIYCLTVLISFWQYKVVGYQILGGDHVSTVSDTYCYVVIMIADV